MLKQLREKALRLGASDLKLSNRKNKRLKVLYDGKTIHFGSATGKTFIDHKDEQKRKAWYARHSKIRNQQGQFVISNPYSASFWAARILW